MVGRTTGPMSHRAIACMYRCRAVVVSGHWAADEGLEGIQAAPAPGGLKFLRRVEKAVPKDQEIHMILDNYSTHKRAKVLDWIERQKWVFLHFTPIRRVAAELARTLLSPR